MDTEWTDGQTNNRCTVIWIGKQTDRQADRKINGQGDDKILKKQTDEWKNGLFWMKFIL